MRSKRARTGLSVCRQLLGVSIPMSNFGPWTPNAPGTLQTGGWLLASQAGPLFQARVPLLK